MAIQFSLWPSLLQISAFNLKEDHHVALAFPGCMDVVNFLVLLLLLAHLKADRGLPSAKDFQSDAHGFQRQHIEPAYPSFGSAERESHARSADTSRTTTAKLLNSHGWAGMTC